MKQFISIFAVILLAHSATAQHTTTIPQGITDLKIKVDNNFLELNWNSAPATSANYWEIQGSLNGEEFSTVGLVMGPDPRSQGQGFKFKQDLNRMLPGIKYYRVLAVQDAGNAYASRIIKASI